MKKISIFLLAGLAGWLSAHAESKLVILMRDGGTHSYMLSQQPTMTFGTGTMTMKSADAEATFELAEVENFHFEDTENSIHSVKDDERLFSYVNGIITVEGQQGQVLLTDLAGRQLHASDKGQSFTFNLKGQPQGTYLLRIGQQIIKLYHK